MIKKIELRILTFLECELKNDKIQEILNFFERYDTEVLLKVVKHSYGASDPLNIPECADTPSLTIDLKNDTLRFKYWNGFKTYWTYHIKDLFESIEDGNKEYEELFNKYNLVGNFIWDWTQQYSNEIYDVRYKYYPEDDIDIAYKIIFDSSMENSPKVGILMDELFKLITDKFSDLKMTLTHRIKMRCDACEKNRGRTQDGKSYRQNNANKI